MREPNRNETRKRVAELRPIDDIFMYQIFKDNVPLTELMLRRIIGIPSLAVQSVNVQYDIELHAAGARSLRLDVLATDADGNSYDIEVQRDDRGALPKRARYHASAMDVTQLGQGEDFSELHDTYVIFITEHDLWKDGEAVHAFDRTDTKTGKPLGDGTHIVYVNGRYHADDPIGDLMHDFLCAQPEDMRIPLMAETCGYFKNTREGLENMCRIIDEYAKEYAKECVMDSLTNNALNLLKMGKLSYEDISAGLGLSREEVAALAKTLS